MKYSTGFRNNILRKVLPPENRSVLSVSKETGVSYYTIRSWMKAAKDGTLDSQDGAIAPSSRNMAEKLRLVLEGRCLKDDDLGRWLRENGLKSEHLEAMTHEIEVVVTDKDTRLRKEHEELKKKTKRLERELARKEKALAEMAALITLKKKADVIWGDGEED